MKSTSTAGLDWKLFLPRQSSELPDLPALTLPHATTVSVEIETAAGKKKVGIHEIHMEEDAGKLIHDEWEDCSLVDYNEAAFRSLRLWFPSRICEAPMK